MTQHDSHAMPPEAPQPGNAALVDPLGPSVRASEGFRGTVDRALAMVVPLVADYAFVHLTEADGSIQEVAFQHRDPAKEPELALLLRELRGPMTAGGSVIRAAIEEGTARQVGVPAGVMVAPASNQPLREAVDRLGPRSFMVVPLRVDDAIVGTISFARFEDDRPYDDHDLSFAKAVAGQTGLALSKVAQIQEIEKARREAIDAADEIRLQARLLDAVGEAVVAVDLEGKIVYWNRAAETLYGYQAHEALGRDLSVTAPADTDRAQLTAAMKALSAGDTWTGEVTLQRRSGEAFPARFTGTPFFDESGDPHGIITVTSDLTQRKELEGQVIQAQRLQAVGGLAGGVAHDLNNALTGIQGFTELILQDLPSHSGARGDLQEIRDAANRAAGLVQQLLAFSRRQLLQPRELDLNRIVLGMSGVLRRVVREDIELVHDLANDLVPTRADPRQVEQVVLNLVQNAVEAMPTGGRLTISTGNQAIGTEESESFQYFVREGAYAVLTVEDTGPGMPDDVKARAFEPFFTTKPPGQGPGLGLSTVYGIVKQSEGYVWIESQPQRGARVRVFLPETEAEVKAPVEPELSGRPIRILLAEDDEAVRTVVRRILEREGFQVMEASNGAEALGVARQGHFDAIVTDVVMPEMSGHEMVRALREEALDLPVLFISGHTDDQVARAGIAEGGYAFLAKPFTREALLNKVREILARGEGERDQAPR